MSPITVYSKDACGQCIATKKYLDSRNVEYNLVHASEGSPEENLLKEAAAKYGYNSAPIVVAGNGNWNGFRPDRLAEAINS